MVKEKKAIEENLLGRSVIYGLMTIVAVIMSFYLIDFLLYWSRVLVSVFVIDGTGSFAIPMLLPYVIVAFVMALILVSVMWRTGRRIQTQWQRKQAIHEEESRVARLMESDDLEDVAYEESDEVRRNEKR